MTLLEQLEAEVAELRRIQTKATANEGKQGKTTVSADNLRRLHELAGTEPPEIDASTVEITTAELTELRQLAVDVRAVEMLGHEPTE